MGVQLFIHFMELLKLGLMLVPEESRSLGNIFGSINATFIKLISKMMNPSTFVDYRSILLCNSVYKMISKLIDIIVKTSLSMHISTKQFRILEGREIQDTTVIT